MSSPPADPIGTPGQPWGPAEVATWRERQRRQRSYEAGVLAAIQGLRDRFEVFEYGRLAYAPDDYPLLARSEEHTSELQSLMRISYAVFCLKKKKQSAKKPQYITYMIE